MSRKISGDGAVQLAEGRLLSAKSSRHEAVAAAMIYDNNELVDPCAAALKRTLHCAFDCSH